MNRLTLDFDAPVDEKVLDRLALYLAECAETFLQGKLASSDYMIERVKDDDEDIDQTDPTMPMGPNGNVRTD